jgi:hypothetical protein
MKPGQALVALRWAKATKEQRSEVGRKLALARWGKKGNAARETLPDPKK